MELELVEAVISDVGGGRRTGEEFEFSGRIAGRWAGRVVSIEAGSFY
jgi:hypothetical protein